MQWHTGWYPRPGDPCGRGLNIDRGMGASAHAPRRCDVPHGSLRGGLPGEGDGAAARHDLEAVGETGGAGGRPGVVEPDTITP